MALQVSDEEIDDAKIAKAMEHHRRVGEFGRMCNVGQIHIMAIGSTVKMTVGEGVVFSEDADVFPSEQLMARLALAIRGLNIGEASALSAYDQFQHSRASVGRSDISMAIEIGYSNVQKITATVKDRRKAGGLRP